MKTVFLSGAFCDISRTFAQSAFALRADLLSPALCQALIVAPHTPQTHSPPIIAPAGFIVCVTCRSGFTTDLVRVSKAFNTEVLRYRPPAPKETPGGTKTPPGGNI